MQSKRISLIGIGKTGKLGTSAPPVPEELVPGVTPIFSLDASTMASTALDGSTADIDGKTFTLIPVSGTLTNRPKLFVSGLGGKNVIYFNNRSAFRRAGNTLDMQSATGTIIAVCAQYIQTTSPALYMNYGHISNNWSTWYHKAAGTGLSYNDWGNSGSGGRISYTMNPSNMAVYTIIRDTNTIKVYRNNSLVTSQSMSTTSLSSASGNFVIGADSASDTLLTESWMGDLAEFHSYPVPLTDDQRASVVSKLQAKWSLSWTPTVLSFNNRVAHWDAGSLALSAGATVSSWSSRVGTSALDLAPYTGTPTMAFTDGYPGVRFGGATHLTTAAGVDLFTGAARTIYVVIYFNGVGSNYANIMDHGYGQSPIRNFKIQKNNTASRFYMPVADSAGNEKNGTDYLNFITGGQRQLLVFRQNSSGYLSLQRNRRNIVTNTGSPFTAGFATRRFTLGGSNDFSGYINGDIHEVVLCDAFHDDTEVNTNAIALSQKWGCVW